MGLAGNGIRRDYTGLDGTGLDGTVKIQSTLVGRNGTDSVVFLNGTERSRKIYLFS